MALKLTLYTSGKLKLPGVDELCADYLARAQRFPGIKVEVRDAKLPESSKLSAVSVVEHLKLQPAETFLLAEWGEQYDSAQFSQALLKASLHTGQLNFVLGNSRGWQRDTCNISGLRLLSLSQLTLNHELAFTILCEQVYRGLSILNQGKYHQE